MPEQRYTLAEAKRILCDQSREGHQIHRRLHYPPTTASGDVVIEGVYACVICDTDFVPSVLLEHLRPECPVPCAHDGCNR